MKSNNIEDRLYTAEVEFDYIKTEIRNNRINKILE